MNRMTSLVRPGLGALAVALLPFAPLQLTYAQSNHGHDKHVHGMPPAKPATPPEAPPTTATPPAAVDHSKMDHSGMDHSTMDHAGMDHAAMGHGPSGESQSKTPRTPIPPITDADREAANRPLHHSMSHGSSIHQFHRFDRLETWDAEQGTGQHWEAEGWIGTDTNRLWLRSAGEREDGRTHAADLELLYGRSISPWWDVVAGVRHDFKPGDSRSFAAIGLMGLAPQKFEVEGTFYAGEGGQTALVLEAERELLLTNRWILQPSIEVELHGRTEVDRGIGSGLGSVEAGLRLRYEVTRRFAPYVGLVHERAFGTTADLRRAEGEGVEETRIVTGVRVWF